MVTPADLGLPARFTNWRQGQLEAIEAIDTSSKKFFLVDAPTGSGKSVIGVGCWRKMQEAYSVLDRMTNDEDQIRHQCVYITRTKQLQTQLIGEFPGMAKTVVGRSNYECLMSIDSFNKGKAAGKVMQRMTGMGPATTEKLTADHCRGAKACPNKEMCPYLIAKSQAVHSPLVVLNTAYFLAEANGPAQFAKARWLIVDEVDSLESELMNFINLAVTERQCAQYKITTPEKCVTLDHWKMWADQSRIPLKATYMAMDQSLARVPQTSWTNVEIKLQKQLTALGSFIEKLGQFLSDVDDTWIITKSTDTDSGSAERLLSKGTKWVLKPTTVRRYAYQYLWRHAERIVGMSGTILDPAILSYDLGIDDHDYVRLDSPFPASHRPIYYDPVARMNYKVMDQALPVMARKISTIMDTYPKDRILVHTVSYNTREYLMKNLPPERLMTHNSLDREAKLEEFKNTRLPKVMLSPSFDRGVDLPSANFAKQVVIVCKIPYPDLSDLQVKARMSQPGGQRWYDIKAAQTLLQMTGRMTRTPTDFTDTYILDGSFANLLSKTKSVLYKWWLEAIKWGGPK